MSSILLINFAICNMRLPSLRFLTYRSENKSRNFLASGQERYNLLYILQSQSSCFLQGPVLLYYKPPSLQLQCRFLLPGSDKISFAVQQGRGQNEIFQLALVQSSLQKASYFL